MIKFMTIIVFLMMFYLPVHSIASQIFDDNQCDEILQSAYAPGMAVFNSCETKIESKGEGITIVKVIIYLQGGILGTSYKLKGRVIIDANSNYYKTRWAYWDSALKPIERTVKIDLKSSKWDF